MYKIGFSKDTHNFKLGNGFNLGGVFIDCKKSVDAYSDGDVVFHSVAESIYGALGMEDLGYYYSKKNKDKGFNSICMIEDTLNQLHKKGYSIVNLDLLIELDEPKLNNYKKVIKENLTKILKLNEDSLSVKATTTEGNEKNLIRCYSNILIKNEGEK
ncbi:2-C-methyl-D-erythritol 2,4-cyclodiphosphate synthase [Spiroplasma litorale]|uniref:2-C-methyl-D-erythritol 2,4-cyclodiphosphate synthase n=1 Tax=Spiroplasma litorale TaxID=216942 RepID=A0A0K1W2Y6_9MOLU|nr:2-C-methyl-D-erythritol 2,4-cyclodiphosphate synthase [Spiroplasma litorale]AKX34684.1 2-C-methyl-D-erythritol 2,4-cyclodiphosphate synthase [Spiroplasma litorale]